MDRNPDFKNLSPLERASRVIYLNKTCYNGLYRVNRAGEFNTPFGKYKNPNIVNEALLRAVSRYLNDSDIEISNKDYAEVVETAGPSDFVYFDPPYHPISDSSSFTGYVEGGWRSEDQIRLRDVCRALDKRGVRFLLSNSSCDFIKELYSEFDIHVVKATRAVNSVSSGRGQIDELLIKNYA